MSDDAPDRSREHLANERTFLAWLRTGVAVIVFGFAIGRFAVALREMFPERPPRHAGLSIWFGSVGIAAGILLTLVGLRRYRHTRAQLEGGRFRAAGWILDVIAIATAALGAALGGYLVSLGAGTP